MKHLRRSCNRGKDSETGEAACSPSRHTSLPMCEARVVRASWLTKDREVILVAIGPDNCERYRVKCDESEVANVAELMWRDTEDNFPHVTRPSGVALGSGPSVARVPLALIAVAGDSARKAFG